MPLRADFIQRLPSGSVLRTRFQFELPPGTLAFLDGGASGEGSAALKAIAGELRPEAGRIIFGEHIWFFGDGRTRLEAPRRPVALVPPVPTFKAGETVRQHVASSLAHLPTRLRGKRLTDILSAMGLRAPLQAMASGLAPEDQWRLVLARALAPRPALLLLDSPFLGLPANLRKALAASLRSLLRQEGTPALAALPDAAPWAEPDEAVASVEVSTAPAPTGRRSVRPRTAVA